MSSERERFAFTLNGLAQSRTPGARTPNAALSFGDSRHNPTGHSFLDPATPLLRSPPNWQTLGSSAPGSRPTSRSESPSALVAVSGDGAMAGALAALAVPVPTPTSTLTGAMASLQEQFVRRSLFRWYFHAGPYRGIPSAATRGRCAFWL